MQIGLVKRLKILMVYCIFTKLFIDKVFDKAVGMIKQYMLIKAYTYSTVPQQK